MESDQENIFQVLSSSDVAECDVLAGKYVLLFSFLNAAQLGAAAIRLHHDPAAHPS